RPRQCERGEPERERERDERDVPPPLAAALPGGSRERVDVREADREARAAPPDQERERDEQRDDEERPQQLRRAEAEMDGAQARLTADTSRRSAPTRAAPAG